MSSSVIGLSKPLSCTWLPTPSRCAFRTPAWRMATETSFFSQPPPPRKWSLDDLSSELLALILEQLRDLDAVAAHRARLISRRLNAIAIPIAYRTLVLTEKLVAPDAPLHYGNVFAYISAYTNHVVARSDLDPSGVNNILDQIRRLFSVRWRYVDDKLNRHGIWLPSDMLAPQQTRFSKTKLYVEDLPLRNFDGALRDSYTRAITTDLLTSLKLASPAPPLATRLDSLKQLVLQSRRLRAFHYEDRGQGTAFKFQTGERMPPFVDLVLRSYDWNHSPQDVALHWNFSQMSSLELVSVPVYNFLASVDFAHLRGLKHLRCEDYSAHLPDRRREATLGLCNLVQHHITALTSLHITCHMQSFSLDAVLAHGSTLQSLTLRDHVGFHQDDRKCPTLSSAQIARLAQGLPYVHTLELDLDTAACDNPRSFLCAVSSFRALHSLTLHVQTTVLPMADDEAIRYDQQLMGNQGWQQDWFDADADSTMRTTLFLMSSKREQNPVLPEWRRVTVNVGGWRKGGMLRRYSESWRQLNMVGVFAERCFVVERRDRIEHGVAAGWDLGWGMVMREEMAAEYAAIDR